jgi:hypothetical protein
MNSILSIVRKKNVIRIGLLVAITLIIACEQNDIPATVDCKASDLALVLEKKRDITQCDISNGAITLAATGGKPPYEFSLNDKSPQSTGVYTDLTSGTFQISVKDASRCEKKIEVVIEAPASSVQAIAKVTHVSGCGATNGSIEIQASSGNPPYHYKIQSESFRDNSKFQNLAVGNYSVIVRDASGCETSVSVFVAQGSTDVSYKSEIHPLLTAKCKNCHSAGGSGGLNITDFDLTKNKAQKIKNRTGNGSMPPGAPLTQAEKDLITCWVNDGAKNN